MIRVEENESIFRQVGFISGHWYQGHMLRWVRTVHKKTGERPNSFNMNDVTEKKGFVLFWSVSMSVGYIAETVCSALTGDITNVCRSHLCSWAVLGH